MRRFYMYSKVKNKIIEIKYVEVIASNKFETLYRITTSNNEEIYEKRKSPLKIYINKKMLRRNRDEKNDI